MALKDLTLDDILDDQIDERAFDEDAGDTSCGDTRFRVRKGEYNMTIVSTRIQEDRNERRSIGIVGKLYNEAGKFRGTVFPEISWQYQNNRAGKLDLKSRLFGNLAAALGAPRGTDLPDFIKGIDQEVVRVYVSEYFRIEWADLLEEDHDGSPDSGYKSMVFINDDKEGDAKAEHYLDLGYKSQGMVLSIKPLS
jgi:hypothetical protein